MNYDVVVIGGGPAGLAAAISAEKTGAKVLLIEREDRLGGVLKQCIHDGFGVTRFGEKLSGCEYATRYIEEINKTQVEIFLKTFVSQIKKSQGGYELVITSKNGLFKVQTKTIIFSTGCREKTPKQVGIHGSRPAGVFTAGTAQYYINVLGQSPGKKCVILGSGDIGLIMARRLTLEGSEVLGVYEAKPTPSGLTRNIFQCLEDFEIPLHLSHTVLKVHGRQRVEGVTVCKVDNNMEPIEGTEEYIKCDTLIVSVGLIPENELGKDLGIKLNPYTKGPSVNQNYKTQIPRVFACGNAVHVNDLADFVSESGHIAGVAAAKYAIEERNEDNDEIEITFDQRFAYVVPQKVDKEHIYSDKVELFFRAREEMKNVRVKVFCKDKLLLNKKYVNIKPPEMEKIIINIEDVTGDIRFTMEDNYE